MRCVHTEEYHSHRTGVPNLQSTMKAARERFFPTPSSTPRASSGPANPNISLHRSNSGSSGARLNGHDSAILSALDKMQNAGLNRPPTQTGHPAFIGKPGSNALVSTSAGAIMRPGTAVPRVSDERSLNVNVVAPTPMRHHQISPPFAIRSGSFGSESLDTSGDNYSKSPDNIAEEKHEESFKMPFPKRSSIQQPGQPELSQYQSKSLPRRVEPLPMLTDRGDQDGSNMSLQRNKKRMRELDENEDHDRNVKRFKTHELDDEDDKISQHGSISGHLERPSSTASSAMGSYHDRPDGNTPPARRFQLERQENLDLNLSIPLNRAHVGLPSRRRSEPIGLDKLLGPGSNDMLDQYADKYEALLKKWSECSVDEWKAGADEISARFSKMLDFAKDYLDKKLKTYSGLNSVLDSHCEILRERSETMAIARQDLVKDTRNVLKC